MQTSEIQERFDPNSKLFLPILSANGKLFSTIGPGQSDIARRVTAVKQWAMSDVDRPVYGPLFSTLLGIKSGIDGLKASLEATRVKELLWQQWTTACVSRQTTLN